MPGLVGGGGGGGGGGGSDEAACLVRSTEGMAYTEPEGPSGGGGGGGGNGGGTGGLLVDNEETAAPPNASSVATEASVLSQFHEDALRQAGLGASQWLLLCAAGLALAADAVELAVVSFVLPSAELELCMSSAQKGWLGGASLLGSAAGAAGWGALADRVGRRRALLSALGVAAGFGVIAAFMPTFGTFLTARLCAALGAGGVLPAGLPYLAEAVPGRAARARRLSLLLTAWAAGLALTAQAAFLILPRTGPNVAAEKREHFGAWHRFLLLTAAPALAAALALALAPESPRFLLEAGRDVEAMMVYQRMYRRNHARGGGAGAQYQLSELELPSAGARRSTVGVPGAGAAVPVAAAAVLPPTNAKPGITDPSCSICSLCRQLRAAFGGGGAGGPAWARAQPVLLLLLLLWPCIGFSLAGLCVWAPRHLQLAAALKFEEEAQIIADQTISDFNKSGTWRNVRYKNCTFLSGVVHNVAMSHIHFINCYLHDFNFSQVTSSRVVFTHSILDGCHFIDSDVRTLAQMENSECNNCVSYGTSPTCRVELDFDLRVSEQLAAAATAAAGLAAGALGAAAFMSWIGRARLLGVSMFGAAMAALTLWPLESPAALLSTHSTFCCLAAMGWAALCVITVELYPAHLRATGCGVASLTGRLGALLGALALGALVAPSRAAPALCAAAPLLLAGVASARLPQPPPGPSLL